MLKPDYLDLDKDGNKTEPMKKAAEDREPKYMGGMYRKKKTEGGMLEDDEKRMGYADGRTVYGEEEGFNLQDEFRKSNPAFIKEMAETQMKDVKNTKDRDSYIKAMIQDKKKVAKRLNVEVNYEKDIKEMIREIAEDNNPLMMGGRQIKNEGGSLLADDMETPMMLETMPETMPEMDTDSDMEENYTRFIMDEALSEEEEDMLVSKLEQDKELQMLFDKVIDVAQEFAGNGPVEGPGTGVSDDIPARLSDGEFVFTAKAVEEIGEDTLMSMMKDAEVAADERQGLFLGGTPDEEEIEDEESNVSTDMRKVNPRYNPNVR